MWFKSKESSYLRVESSESGSELESDKERNLQQRNVSLWTYLATVGLIGILCLIVGFACGEFIQDNGLLARLRATSKNPSQCLDPVTRKEWRSLSTDEKQDYISAVQCLTTKQSKLSKGEGDTLYNDFPYVHTTIGGYCEHMSTLTCVTAAETSHKLTGRLHSFRGIAYFFIATKSS
jgi:hypothetical protein